MRQSTRKNMTKTCLLAAVLFFVCVELSFSGTPTVSGQAASFVPASEQGLVDIQESSVKGLEFDPREQRLLGEVENVDFDDDGVRLAKYALGVSGSVNSKILEVPFTLDSVSVVWYGQDGISDGRYVRGFLRTSSNLRSWSDWVPFESAGSESTYPGIFESSHVGVPAKSKYVQLRLEFLGGDLVQPPAVNRVRLIYTAKEGVAKSDRVGLGGQLGVSDAKPGAEQQMALATQAVSAPRIISRTEWGCPDGEGAPAWPPMADNTPITHLVVHHTLLGTQPTKNPTDYKAWVYNIWKKHHDKVVNGQLQGDIGYNLLIDPKGNVYEGRAGGVDEKGAHFACFNSHTTGIALLGDFTSAQPTKQALAALKQVLAWRAQAWGIDPKIHAILQSPDPTRPLRDIPQVAGHKDINPVTWSCNGDDDYRTCPGDALYALLPGIRNDVAKMLPPGFSVQVQPDSQIVFLTQGQQATVRVTLDSLGGLAGTASLSVTGLPSGMSVAPTTAYLPADGYVTANLVFKAGLNTQTGTFSPTITAAVGGIQRSARMTLTVNPAPGTVTVKATYNGQPWSGAVDYSIVGPQGVIIGTAVPGSTSNLPAGQYKFTYNKGGPGSFSSVTPATTQNLTSGGAVTFTINFGSSVSALAVTCSASPAIITAGQSTKFTASASGGVGPYLYTWSGAVSGNTPSVTKVFNTAGTYYATVTASDGSLQSKQATCSVQVNAAVAGSFDVYTFSSSKTVQAGQGTSFDLYFQPQNGFSGQVGLSVSGLPAGASMTSGSQLGLSGTSSVPYTLTIQTSTATPVGVFPLVFTAIGQGVTRTVNLTLTTTAPPPQALSASCSIVPNPITLGQGATVYAQATGGVSPYRYIINGFDMGTISSQLVMPSSTGTFTVPVTIYDSVNQRASSSCSAQVVAANPYVTGFSYSPNPAKAGQVVNLNIYGGNFISGTTQVWFVGPGCSSPGCQTYAVNVSGSAYIGAQAVLNLTGTYTVNIRNGTGSWVQAGAVTVIQ